MTDEAWEILGRMADFHGTNRSEIIERLSREAVKPSPRLGVDLPAQVE